MNMLKRLLVTALALSASHVSAFTNKNFNSSPRPQNASLLLDSHVTRDLAATKGHDRFGGNFLVSGSYSESNKAADLGKYFGVNEKASFTANAGNAANTTADVNAGFLVHDGNAATAVVAPAPATHGATINLAPKTTTYSVEFAYVQCLGKILDGLHLSISLPVERVENNMNLTVTGGIDAAHDAKALTDFLSGNLTRAANGPDGWGLGVANRGSQAALKNALINGKQPVNGIADVGAVLGYDFIKNDDWTAGLNIGLSIPTGNAATGKNVFEPIYGSVHWGLGFGGKVCGNLWHDGDQRIGLHLSADYRYGFQANETRTLSGKDNWSQYFLTGKVDANQIVTKQFDPVANFTTVAVSVTPNSSVRGNLGLEYGNGGFVFGVHYAPAWKQAESLAFNGAFVDDAVAIVNPITATNTAVALTAAGFTANAQDGLGIKKADLSLDASKREAQLSHRIGGDLGYTFKEWEFPVALGVGGHYELNKDNASIQNWGVNIKAGIGF